MTVAETALIIAAVPDERRAILEHLRDQHGTMTETVELKGRYYDVFTWPGRGKWWQVYVGQPTEKGPHATSALVPDFVRSRPPQLVLMVGMCGGLPEHGATEGDVVVARHVYNYEPGRDRGGESRWTPSSYRGTPRVRDLANQLNAKGTFGAVKVHTSKDYGSGESLLDDLQSQSRERIVAFSDDLIAFEMEGVGLLHAAWELLRTNTFEVALVKGVADYGDGKQRDNKAERQRRATQNALAVALSLLTHY